jgi:hypothetical protein
METLPSTWKLDDTRRNLEALIMNGTLQNFNNLRAERQENYDKRKKILQAIYQSDQSEYSMVFVYCSIAPMKVIHTAICLSLIYLFCRPYPLEYII